MQERQSLKETQGKAEEGKGVTTERKGRVREKTGNDEKGEGEGSFCRAKCCNHPPPGRKVHGVKLSQVSGELRGGVMSSR